jgi:hypothetical protein
VGSFIVNFEPFNEGSCRMLRLRMRGYLLNADTELRTKRL